MAIPIYQIDAFTSHPFGGNPACVCLMGEDKPDSWLQSVAAEMNLSETAFVWRRDGHFHLRWFTPITEAKLCGHATLATSHALWDSGWLDPCVPAVYHSLGGRLEARRQNDFITLDFPAKHPTTTQAPAGLLEALAIEPICIVTDGSDYLIEVESEENVRQLFPDFLALRSINARGIIVTSESRDTDFDFVSRFFAPAVGINEDPVTGSAHCLLAPYWSKRLGVSKFRARQASRRGGELCLKLENNRVFISGQTRTIFTGTLHI